MTKNAPLGIKCSLKKPNLNSTHPESEGGGSRGHPSFLQHPPFGLRGVRWPMTGPHFEIHDARETIRGDQILQHYKLFVKVEEKQDNNKIYTNLCILYEYQITYLLSLSLTTLNDINCLEQGKMHTAKKWFLSRNCQIRQMCVSPKLNSSEHGALSLF